MKGVSKQWVEFDRQFAIKLELMPLEVRSLAFPAIYYFIISGFLLLATIFLSFAFNFSWNFILGAWLAVLMALFWVDSLTKNKITIKFSQERILLRKNPWSFFGRVYQNESLEDFSHMVGKRYYGFFFAGDEPSLFREVILKHKSKPECSIVLARFVESHYVDLEKEWKDYWHKASLILDKPVLSQVDDRCENIDEAQIILQDGDGGALRP